MTTNTTEAAKMAEALRAFVHGRDECRDRAYYDKCYAKARELLRAYDAAQSGARVANKDYPETFHSRDCAYVVESGPAPCTCGAIELIATPPAPYDGSDAAQDGCYRCRRVAGHEPWCREAGPAEQKERPVHVGEAVASPEFPDYKAATLTPQSQDAQERTGDGDVVRDARDTKESLLKLAADLDKIPSRRTADDALVRAAFALQRYAAIAQGAK